MSRTNRFGYRVEYDRVDGEHYVVDAHGSTINGPFATEEQGWRWIADWVARMDRLRALVEAQQEAARGG